MLLSQFSKVSQISNKKRHLSNGSQKLNINSDLKSNERLDEQFQHMNDHLDLSVKHLFSNPSDPLTTEIRVRVWTGVISCITRVSSRRKRGTSLSQRIVIDRFQTKRSQKNNVRMHVQAKVVPAIYQDDQVFFQIRQ